MFRAVTVGLVILATSLTLMAATVNKIVIKSNTAQNVSPDVVRAHILLVEGAAFSQEQLSKDIKSLYKTGQFDDVVAKAKQAQGDTIDVVFTITPKARINTIVLQGNEAFATKRLMKQLEQETNLPMDETQLSADLEALYAFYRGKGYNNINIEQKIETLEDTGDIRIVYLIEENGRAKTRGVDFIGNTVFSDRQLRAKMDTEVSWLGFMLPMGYYNESDFDSDQNAVTQAYLDAGYLDFKVIDVAAQHSKGGEKVFLTIKIDEGSPYTVAEVSITGNEAEDTAALQPFVSLAANQTYSRATERRDVDKVTAYYNSLGYMDSRVIARREPSQSDHTVSVVYQVLEGEQARIRNINIQGNRITKDHVIRRELRLQPGDLADASQVKTSKAALMNLGYFGSVEVHPRSTPEAGFKDLDVEVEETLTGQLLFGAGVSSTDSIVGTVEMSQTNFDLFGWPSFRGGGQRFRLRAEAGSSRSNFTLAFTEPWMFDRQLRFDTELWLRETSANREYDQRSIGNSYKLTRAMSTPFWRQSVGYRLEQIEISDVSDSAFSAKFAKDEEDSELVSALSMGFVRDHRNKAVMPSSGSRININGEFQAEALGSYSTLYKLKLGGEKYWPVFKRSIFKLSAEMSQVEKVEGAEPSIFDRLFAGGAHTIRGFEERSVGPTDRDVNATAADHHDEPVGGRSRFLTTAELNTPLYSEQLYGAVFVDAGNVWMDSWEFGNMNVGAGVGLRLFVKQLGAVSVDYGWPINRAWDHLEDEGRLHFNLGYNF